MSGKAGRASCLMVSLPTPEAPVMTKRIPRLVDTTTGGQAVGELLGINSSHHRKCTTEPLLNTGSKCYHGAPEWVTSGNQVHLHHGRGRVLPRKGHRNVQHGCAAPGPITQRHGGQDRPVHKR